MADPYVDCNLLEKKETTLRKLIKLTKKSEKTTLRKLTKKSKETTMLTLTGAV